MNDFVSSSDLVALGKGVWLSFLITVFSLLIGLPLGATVAWARDAGPRWLRWPTVWVVEFGRGSPSLIILYFVYFGLPSQGITVGAMTAIIATFAYGTAAYTSEMFRSALRTIPAGQKEAARSLGLGARTTYLEILLPQALRIASPALITFSVIVFQGTALGFTVALPVLLAEAYQLGASSFEYTKYLTLAAAFYILVAWPGLRVARWAERRATASVLGG